MKRLSLWAAAAFAVLAFGCPSGTTCRTNADCARGQVCSASMCVAGTGGSGGSAGGTATGGGTGTGGGVATGGGSGTGGGTATGGGTGTGGGTATGGGTGTGGGTATGGGVGGGSAMADGETCAAAVTIAAGVTTGTTVGATNDYDFGDSASGSGSACQGYSTAGAPDKVYKISVPNGQRLSVNLTPLNADGGVNTSAWDPTLNLISSTANCGARGTDGGTQGIACLSGSDTSSAENASFVNASSGPADVFILIDGWTATEAGLFSLTTTLSAAASGDVCANATPLMNATGESLSNFGNDYSSCNASTGPDRVYSLSVANGDRATISVTADIGADGGRPIVNLALVGSAANCGASTLTCLTTASTSNITADGGTTPAVLNFLNTTGAATTIFAVVDSTTAGAGYSISTNSAAAPAGDTCATATALPLNMTTAGQSLATFGNDFTSGCAATAGNDRAYTFSVPNGERASVAVTGAVGVDGGRPIMNLALVDVLASCQSSLSCVVSGSSSNLSDGGTTPARGDYFNASGAAKTVYAVVDSITPGADFSIVTTSVVPPMGDTCVAPTPLTPNMPLLGQTLSTFANDYTASGQTGCVLASGPDRVYSVTVPPNNKLTVVGQPDAGLDTSVNLMLDATTCAAKTCVASSDSDVASYFNSGTTARDVLIVVDSFTANQNAGHTFNITANVGPVTPGDSCGSPTALTPNMTLMDSFMNWGPDHAFSLGSGCRTATGKDAVYSVSVPAGQQLVATLTTAAVDTVLNIVDASMLPVTCGAGATCVASSDSGNPEVATYVNTTSAAKLVYIVASAYSSQTTTASFTIAAAIAAPPMRAGETCAAPTVVMSSPTAVQWTTSGATRNYTSLGTGCTSSTGPESVFQVTVPNGQTLTATVASATDSVINVVDTMTCAPTGQVCLATRDATGSNNTEVYTFTNSTGAPKTLFLLVSAYSFANTATMDYTLLVQIQ